MQAPVGEALVECTPGVAPGGEQQFRSTGRMDAGAAQDISGEEELVRGLKSPSCSLGTVAFCAGRSIDQLLGN